MQARSKRPVFACVVARNQSDFGSPGGTSEVVFAQERATGFEPADISLEG
jgi:hypothetical protein